MNGSKLLGISSAISTVTLLAGCAGGTNGSAPTAVFDAVPYELLESFEGCRLRGGEVSEGGTCRLGEESYERDGAIGTAGDTRVILFDIAPDTATCDFGHGSAPGGCLTVNGELFYDTIEGYAHREGQGAVIAVRRTQTCDPAEIDSCPADAGIYRYEFVESYAARP